LTIKPGQLLISLSEEYPRAVLMHPAQQEMANTIAQLITWLRACETLEHCYEFQRHLFGYLYEAQERHQQCSRVVKRLKRGQSLPTDVPPPPSGDPTGLATWQLELYVHERLIRQLRTVGDGFAWTFFGYDRRIILALSRNDSPGISYGKDGLPYELGAIQELWKTKQHFALHHDLTNCLRIADLTEFTADGKRLFHEIKAKPHTEKKQLERAQAVVDAINSGGVLPNSTGDSRLVELKEPYVTNLKPLNDLLQLAKRNGCHGMKLSQGRAIVASSLPAMIGRFRNDMEAGAHFLDVTRQQAYKRASIDKAMHHIKGYSGDTASRSPIMAPWSIYPFSPADCAGIICDFLFFDTTVSADALVESLERAGLRGEVLLAPAHGNLEGDMPAVRAYWRDRAITWHAHGLGQLLYELAEPDALARGIRELIQMDDPPGEPVVIYGREAASWYTARRKSPRRERTAEHEQETGAHRK
jgi:hypothetical protein